MTPRRRLLTLIDRVVTEHIDRERYPSSRVQEHRVLMRVGANIISLMHAMETW